MCDRGRPTGHVRFGLFRSRVPILGLLDCDHLGALCTFGWPIFHLLPCGIIWSGAPCRIVWGCSTGQVEVGPFRSRVPVSVFLSCDHPGTLCMFKRPIFPLLTCGIVQSGVPCHVVWGYPTEHASVDPFRSRAPVTVLLSCDCLGALWLLGCLDPFAVFSHVASFGQALRVRSCEVARMGTFGSGCFIWRCPYHFC